MKTIIIHACFLLFLIGASLSAAERLNVLFVIADDASRHYGKAYDCDWASTPNIDLLSVNGLVFDNAYVPTSKCGPCRSAIMTGRNPWQLGAGANHQSIFPPEHKGFGEVLTASGIACGRAGKMWGPGTANDKEGRPRDFGFTTHNKNSGFEEFLSKKKKGVPFLFWYGSSNPHRGYPKGAGLKRGKKLTDIDHVPAYWPDNATIRGDMLDYSTEIEAFDKEVGGLLAVLKKTGHAKNTIVIVTSDHGMPFPRVKGHTYDDAHRVPFIVHWPGVTKSTQRVSELITLTDLAPTLFELFSVKAEDAGMDFTGNSFVDLFKGSPRIERPFVIIGRERNDVNTRPGYPHGAGYPARGIRMDEYLYVHNFKPDRWPCGNPETGMRDTDNSPTKQLINALNQGNTYWEHSFGKRPAAQLFNVVKDPDCVVNLAGKDNMAKLENWLHGTLMKELKRQKDPRVLGEGEAFDKYLSRKGKKPRKKK